MTTPLLINKYRALVATSTRPTVAPRRPLRYCGISGSRADLNDELACGIKNALLVTAIISFRQFDQFRQTHALVLPKCIVDVDIFREPVGLQMRFELQVVDRSRIFHKQIAGGNRNRRDDRHEQSDGADNSSQIK